jgi:NAD(P)-dependent dehydrogenase (short-subunit alcohol dehydrogenase family)
MTGAEDAGAGARARALAGPAGLDAAAVGDLAPARALSLAGRVALVTGAGGDIGAWLAAGLGAAGAALLVTDADAERLAHTEALLAAAGVPVAALALDLTAPDAPARLVAAATDRHGRLDALVNCAAINRREPILDVAPQTWDALVAVDLRAPYFLAQAAARAMIDAGHGGAIVNVGSINVAVGLYGVSVYGAAKAGLAQLTKVMAVEWSEHGIRANCLAPGFMATRLSRPVWEDPRRRAWMLDRIPQKRPGHPRELVGPCVLLCSDAGAYLTGQTLFVDGGFLAGSPW